MPNANLQFSYLQNSYQCLVEGNCFFCAELLVEQHTTKIADLNYMIAKPLYDVGAHSRSVKIVPGGMSS